VPTEEEEVPYYYYKVPFTLLIKNNIPRTSFFVSMLVDKN
jgi:hypothetical protein